MCLRFFHISPYLSLYFLPEGLEDLPPPPPPCRTTYPRPAHPAGGCGVLTPSAPPPPPPPCLRVWRTYSLWPSILITLSQTWHLESIIKCDTEATQNLFYLLDVPATKTMNVKNLRCNQFKKITS